MKMQHILVFTFNFDQLDQEDLAIANKFNIKFLRW